MFELSSGARRRAPHRSSIPVLISTAARVIILGVLLAIPILYVSAELPEGTGHARFRRVGGSAAASASTAAPAPASTPSKPKEIKRVPG
jgi:hypothetical protein